MPSTKLSNSITLFILRLATVSVDLVSVLWGLGKHTLDMSDDGSIGNSFPSFLYIFLPICYTIVSDGFLHHKGKGFVVVCNFERFA